MYISCRRSAKSIAMYRSTIRIPARAPPRLFLVPAFRTVTTAPPPPSGQPAPNPAAKKGGINTLLYALLGAAAAGSAYYYFTQEQAKSDEGGLKNKARDAVDIAKDKSADAEKRAREDYQQIKDKVVGLKTTMEKDLRASEGAARNNLNRARESTENLYQEARSSAEHKAHETRELAEKQAAEAKRGWFSWWGRK